jgi:dTDP-4-dehydrorhamnose 3,5-epimerase
MIFERTTLQDAFVVKPELRGDARGAFGRTFCQEEFAQHGLVATYVQQNMSETAQAGTVRGLHFQRAPHAEAKLIRAVRGAVYDVIVDLRPGSPSYMRWEGFELTDKNHWQIYVPPGFAHGFQTLTDDVELTYLMGAFYTPSAEGGVRYDDPTLAIVWPRPVTVLSARDTALPVIDSANPPAL